MKPRECEVYGEARHSEIGGQCARRGKPRRVVIETSRHEFIANLPVKLLMQWFGRCAIQSDHFESHYRMATPLPIKIWRWMFSVRRSPFSSDHEEEHEHERE
jgi:hypothetical protein